MRLLFPGGGGGGGGEGEKGDRAVEGPGDGGVVQDDSSACGLLNNLEEDVDLPRYCRWEVYSSTED